MKKYYRILSAMFLWIFLISNVSAINHNNGNIILDKENHQLIAPGASSCLWYLNGELIQDSGNTLKINTPGTYQVIMTDELGEKKSASLTLGINADGEVYTIWIIGDSTACDWASGYYPQKGWGQMLPWFFDENVIIKNEALSGRSAKSFYDNHWTPIRDNLQPGDFVFIQFGINDAKSDDPTRYTIPFTTFQDYLTSFVNESKEKGAFPVILTTVRRNAWNNTEPPTLYPAYHDYPVAARQLAGKINVPLIDLDQLTVPLLEGLGPDYVGPFMYKIFEPGEYPNYPDGSNDNVHFQEMGAIEMARLVVNRIQTAVNDTILNRLIPHIKPMNKVAVSTNYPDNTIITRSASYPEGINVTLKVMPDFQYELMDWLDKDGNSVSNDRIYQFTMGTDSLSFQAVVDYDAEPDCNGEYFADAYVDECGTCVEGNTGLKPCNFETTHGVYKITALHTSLCIQEGEDIAQEECSRDSSQFWEIYPDGKYYQIWNVGTGKYINYEALAASEKIIPSESAVLWRFEKIGQDTFQIAPWGDPVLILEVAGGGRREGVNLRLYNRNDRSHQQFIFWEMDPGNCSGYPCTTSIEAPGINTEFFKIIPNPISQDALLEFTSETEVPVTLEIFSLQGKMVFQQIGITGKRVRFGSELAKGMYIVKASSGKYMQTMKLMKY